MWNKMVTVVYKWLLMAAFITCVDAVLLRLRLADGSVQRIDIDENERISTLWTRLSNLGISDTAQLTFKGKKIERERSSILTLSDLAPRPGDILQVSISKDKINDRIDDFEDNDSDAWTQASSKTLHNIAPTSSQRVKSRPRLKKMSMNIQDLENRRRSLIKMTRQSPSVCDAVYVSSSIQRILTRVSNTGTAVLLGYVDKKYKTKNSKSSYGKLKASDSSTKQHISKKNNHGKYSRDATRSGSNANDEDELTVVCIIGCIEDITDFSISQMDKIDMITKSAGMEIVGCCVGATPASEKEGRTTWSPAHLYAGLYLRQYTSVINKSYFTVFDATMGGTSQFKMPKYGKIIGKGAIGSTRRIKMTKNDSNDLSLEAYFISNLTTTLLDRKIIPQPSHDIIATLLNKRRSMDTKKDNSKMESGDVEPEQLHLVDGQAVLYASDEVTSVDPLLLAVPCQIRIMEEGQGFTRPHFIHTFPTPNELLDGHTANIARSYLFRLLGKTRHNKPLTWDTIERLRDPHLLLYMSELVDQQTMKLIVQTIFTTASSSESISMPYQVTSVLEIVRMSLGVDDDADSDCDGNWNEK